MRAKESREGEMPHLPVGEECVDLNFCTTRMCTHLHVRIFNGRV